MESLLIGLGILIWYGEDIHNMFSAKVSEIEEKARQLRLYNDRIEIENETYMEELDRKESKNENS